MKMKRAELMPPWTPFEKAFYDPDPVRHAKMMQTTGSDELFKNSRYTVNLRHMKDGWTYLSVKRNDKSPMRYWRELQRIKNEICGPEREAVELFPAESRMVDTSNQYHLWVAPEGVRFPLGFDDGRLVLDYEDKAGAKQEPFEHRPEDADSANALFKSYTQIAASKFKVGTPEYHDCIIQQHSDFMEKLRAEKGDGEPLLSILKETQETPQ